MRDYFQHLKVKYPGLIGLEWLEVRTSREGYRWNNFSEVTTHYQWRPKYGKQLYKTW
jgi:hypothetical protein